MRWSPFFLMVLFQLLPGYFQNVIARSSNGSATELFKCPVSSGSSASKYLELSQIKSLESDLDSDQSLINQLIDELKKREGSTLAKQFSPRELLLQKLEFLLHNFILKSVCLHGSDSASANDYFESLFDYEKNPYTSPLYLTVYKSLEGKDRLLIDMIFEAFRDLDTHGDN